MKLVKRVNVRKSKWKVQWRDFQNDPSSSEDMALGWCHESKVIELDKNLTESLTAEIAIHEFTHAFFPDLSEDTVTLFGKQVADFLSSMELIHYEEDEDDLQ